MTVMKLSNDQKDFLNSFLENFMAKYPKRFVNGVIKYGTVIHKDYTIEEHLDNAEEELFDGMAYIHATRFLVNDLRAENERLKARIEDLEHE